jgi:hypothetical protein
MRFVAIGGAIILARSKGRVAMPPRRRGSGENGDGEEREREREENERRERPHGRGRERQAFLDYLARRWIGSSPPTAEAYARAESQWRQLPGAVITLPTDLGTAQGTGTTEGEGADEP